ncbi:MAG: transglutaminase family protein [Anaerolineales bacterium]|nr:transglutaminase family protein [Anaerolineales bacterium]
MERTLDSVLQYYSVPGVLTQFGEFSSLVEGISVEVNELAKIIQGLMIHIFWAEREGRKLSEKEKDDVNLRTAKNMLRRIAEISSDPLISARENEDKLIGNCKDHSVLATAIFRYCGIPARARCGFGTYFLPNHFEDHWICEYWKPDEARWVGVDFQLNPFQVSEMNIKFDPLDVPPSCFVPAGRAWKMCRTGKQDPEIFGIFDMKSWWFIRGNVIRDLASLNKVETLPWDVWGIIGKSDEEMAEEETNLMDEISDLLIMGDGCFNQIQYVFENDFRIKIPN